MSKKIARLLKADLQESSDLKSIAAMLAGKGRGGDTILAHITPKEVRLLKESGGAGTVNPETGLLEFYDGFDTEGFEAPSYQIPQQYSYGSDYAEAQPAQVGTQDFYQPYTPVELTAPEGYAPTPSSYETSIPYTQNMVAETQPYTGQAVGYEAPQVVGGVQGFGAPAPAVRGDVAPAPAAVKEGTVTPVSPSLATRAGDILSAIKAGGGDVLDYLKKNPDVLKYLGAGAGSVATALQAKKGAQQVQQATQEQKNIASPYQKIGAEEQRAAMAGELSPQQLQALQSARAQIAQGIEARGGVGVNQAATQLEGLRQQLLQQRYDYGIKLSNIGDQIAIGAIRTGLQADQAVNQLTNSMYSNMFAIASGISPQQIKTQSPYGATNA